MQKVNRTFLALKNVSYIGLLKFWASNYHTSEVFVKIKSIIYALVDHTCKSFCLIIEVGKCRVYSIHSWLCYSCWGTFGAEKENGSCIFQLARDSGDLIDNVLATLVENKVVPDPFFRLQN